MTSQVNAWNMPSQNMFTSTAVSVSAGRRVVSMWCSWRIAVLDLDPTQADARAMRARVQE